MSDTTENVTEQVETSTQAVPESIPDSAEKSKEQTKSTDAPRESPLLTNYLRNLGTFFTPLELKKQWRCLNVGLFVDCELVQKLLQTFGEFRHKETKQAMESGGRMLSMIFGTAFPPQFYLLEGKICLVGYLINYSQVSTLGINIPHFRGSLIDAREQLHPRDPLLASISGVSASLDNTGFSVKVTINNNLCTLDLNALKEFNAVLSYSPRLKSRFRNATRSLRDSLMPLIKMFSRAVLVKPKQTLFIPGRFRLEKRTEFYRNGGVVFVVSAGKLLSVYELRGRNLLTLIDQEINALIEQRQYRVAALELSRKPGAIVAAVRTPDGEHNLLHVQTVIRMLELTLRRRSLRNSVKSRLTLFDLFRLLSNMLCDTIRIEPREVPYVLLKSYLNILARQKARIDQRNKNKIKNKKYNTKSGSLPDAVDPNSLRYRSGGGWIFFIHDRRVIKSMLERKVPVSSKIKILNGPAKLDSQL